MDTKTEKKEDSSDNESGDEKYSSDSRLIPEELQKEAIELIESCKTTQCTSYIRELCYKKDEDLSKKENKGKKPSEFSTAGGPVDY